jgi:hypothetical protein
MMSHLKRILGYPRTTPITSEMVSTAPQDPRQEREAKEATGRLVGEVMKVQRSSWEIRQTRASGALSIVAGDKE